MIRLVFKPLLEGLCDLVYPPHCLLCQSYLRHRFPTIPVCPQCALTLTKNLPPFCPKCSRHIKSTAASPKCRTCAKRDVHFDFAWGAFLFNDPLKILIHKYKYGDKTYLKHYFAKLMATFIEDYSLDIGQFDMIMPIPLYTTRYRERGYNQAALMAEILAKQYSICLNINTLKRVVHTEQQTQLNQKERWTNVCGAFKIVNSTQVRDTSILLVDDLLTTGATASEASRVLKSAGAKTVGVLTLAITP